MIYFDVVKYIQKNGYWRKLRALRKFENRKAAVEYAKAKGHCVVGVNHSHFSGMIWAFNEFVDYANETRVKIGNKPNFRESMVKSYRNALRLYEHFK